MFIGWRGVCLGVGFTCGAVLLSSRERRRNIIDRIYQLFNKKVPKPENQLSKLQKQSSKRSQSAPPFGKVLEQSKKDVQDFGNCDDSGEDDEVRFFMS